MNTPNFSPNTHIFLWDLHDVILEKSLWEWFMNCVRFKRKREVIRHLNKKTIKIALLFFLERLKIIKKQMIEHMLPGSLIIDIAAEAGGNCELNQTNKICCMIYFLQTDCWKQVEKGDLENAR